MYVIKAKASWAPVEEIDEAETSEDARYLVQEYQVAFGAQYVIWSERA